MDPKQQALRNKQKERHDRGQDFQLEIKNSWRLIPNIWTMPIPDGRGGSRAADRITISQEANFLTELKRTSKKSFQLDFLRPNQIRGLLDFDQVIERNYGLVLVSFHDLPKGIDEAYAVRLTKALQAMHRMDTRNIPLDVLREMAATATDLTEPTAVKLPRLDNSDPAYDLKGVIECYKSL